MISYGSVIFLLSPPNHQFFAPKTMCSPNPPPWLEMNIDWFSKWVKIGNKWAKLIRLSLGGLSVSVGLTWHDEGGTKGRWRGNQRKAVWAVLLNELVNNFVLVCPKSVARASKRIVLIRKTQFAFYSNRLKYLRWWFLRRVLLKRCPRGNSLRVRLWTFHKRACYISTRCHASIMSREHNGYHFFWR